MKWELPLQTVKSGLAFFFLVGCTACLAGSKSVLPASTAAPAVLVAATPTAAITSTTVGLEIGDKRILIEFLQNGMSVPLMVKENQGSISLKPEPFSIRMHGDGQNVSIMAFRNRLLFLPIEQSKKPVAVFGGTGNGYTKNNIDLYTTDEPLETYDGSKSFFTDVWGVQPAEAVELSSFLEKAIGITPTVLVAVRYYLPLDSELLTIDTVDGSKIQNGKPILLVVFLEKELGQDFSEVRWFEFHISFFTS